MAIRWRANFVSHGRLALAAALALAAGPALAQQETFSPGQKQAIEKIVTDFLIQNPEVLSRALAEVERHQQERQKKAQQAAIATLRTTIESSPGSTIVGNPSGDVTLVEFFDYNCGYCKRALSDIRTLIKSDPKLRVVLKDLPVLGPESRAASRVALAVRQQVQGDKLFEYHSRLLDTRGKVDGERAVSLAREMGLDMARLQRDLDGAEVRLAMQQNEDLAQKLGVNGTPAFVIGDEVVPGAVGADLLREAIAGMRKCGQAVCG